MANLAELTKVSEALASLELQVDGTVSFEKSRKKRAGKKDTEAVCRKTTERDPFLHTPEDSAASASVSPSTARIDPASLIPPEQQASPPGLSVPPSLAAAPPSAWMPPAPPAGLFAGAPPPLAPPQLAGALAGESCDGECTASLAAPGAMGGSRPGSGGRNRADAGMLPAGPQAPMAGGVPGAAPPAAPPGLFASRGMSGFSPLPVGVPGCGAGFGGCAAPPFPSPADVALSQHHAFPAGMLGMTPSMMGSTPISPVSPTRHSLPGASSASSVSPNHRPSLQAFGTHTLHAQAAAAAAAADAARMRAAQAQAAYQQLLMQHTGTAKQQHGGYLHQPLMPEVPMEASKVMAERAAAAVKCAGAVAAGNGALDEGWAMGNLSVLAMS